MDALRVTSSPVVSIASSPAASLASSPTPSSPLVSLNSSSVASLASSPAASVAGSLADTDGEGQSADWSDTDGASAIPGTSRASSPEVGTKRKRKRYASDKVAKKEHWRRKRQREQEELGPTAPRPPKHHEIPDIVQATLTPVSHFPVNTTGYTTNRIGSIQPDVVWTFLRLRDISIEKVLAWDGIKPIGILDDEGRIIAVLAGRPIKDSGAGDDWDKVVAGLEAAIAKLKRQSSFTAKDQDHRRGPHPAKAYGVSHGGGQTQPSVLDLGSKKNCRAADAFRSDPSVIRAAHFANAAFSTFAPKLYERYCDYLERLRRHDPTLTWNFPRSVFPAMTVNFGPNAVCYDHLDFGNAAAGWCAITSAGSYDPKLGGHLILFDIDLIVEFPPGSTILIPSSIMRHGNTPIQDGETRVGITQYAAGGLFRYVDHGFSTQDKADPKVRARVLAEGPSRFEKLLSLYSRIDTLEQDRKNMTLYS